MSRCFLVFSRGDDPECVTAEIAERLPSGEPRVLNSTFHSNSHADALLRALRAAVGAARKKDIESELVVNDRAVVRLVSGDEQNVGRRIAEIREMLSASGGRIQVRYGRARDVFGEFAEQLS